MDPLQFRAGQIVKQMQQLKKKDFGRRQPTETLSWTAIEKILNMADNFVRDCAKVKTFRKEKSNQIIGILVGPALPWFMRLGEINKCMQLLFELTEIGKFRSIIQTDAVNW